MYRIDTAGFALPVQLPDVGVFAVDRIDQGFMALLPTDLARFISPVPQRVTQDEGWFDPDDGLVIPDADLFPDLAER